MSFEQSLRYGHEGEEMVAEVFRTAGFSVTAVPCRSASHGARRDLVVARGNIHERIEVKREDRYAESDNLCIETQQGFGHRERPAGIEVSESTVTVHLFGDECYVYRTTDMRNYIHEMAKQQGVFLRHFGNSDNNNCGYLVPKLWLAVGRIQERGWGAYCKFDELPQCKVFEWNMEVAA